MDSQLPNKTRSVQEAVNLDRRQFLRTAAVMIAATQSGAVACAKPRSDAAPLGLATQWLNSPKLTDHDLQGKAVLVNFWTYSCINWRRQLPYVRAWTKRYRDHGLVVLGVHTPEFSFEKNPDNVQWAAKNMHIPYPIAIDSDRAVWTAFNNEYWPALYFIDAKGRLRHSVFGEGQYEESESFLRKLLTEAGSRDIGEDSASVEVKGLEAAADWKELRSRENYVGFERTANFASSEGMKADKAHVYSVKESLRLNQWGLSGGWTAGREAVVLNRPDGSVSYCFHARDLNFVLGPAAPGSSVRFRVRLNGRWPGAEHGVDVDELGNGVVVEPRMYQLIRQGSRIVDRQFTIQFLDSGVAAYSFTFG